VDTASLALSGFGGLCKKPPNDLFHLVWLDTLSENATPRTGVRHALSFEMEELTQFTCSQFGPMSHASAAILSG